jgi:DNA-binding NarL/FixJ family response regulator
VTSALQRLLAWLTGKPLPTSDELAIIAAMKTLLVDDHLLFSEGLTLLMEQSFEEVVCFQSASIAEALERGAEHPDLALILLDLGLPDSQGQDGLRRLQARFPTTPLVVMSADARPQTVIDSIEAGAQGFIPKSARPAEMREALACVLAGGIYVPSALAGGASAPKAADAIELNLSNRQIDVLRLLIAGCANKVIARELGLSESTVKTHVAAIFQRLEVNTRTQAVIKVASLGLRLPH